MKRDIVKFVSQCLVCQQVKAEHQKLIDLLHSLSIPKWKWDHITMDFITCLLRTSKGHDVDNSRSTNEVNPLLANQKDISLKFVG